MTSLTREERKEKEKVFIDSIQGKICELASAYHNGDDCDFFRDPESGSYNVCFFVQFFRRSGRARDKTATGHNRPRGKPDGDRWIVRVPLEICLAIKPWEKVETEVATMQVLASKTTIPIPKVYAYSAAREKGPYGVSSFMILEYVDGKKLSEIDLNWKGAIPAHLQRKLNLQLADIYMQLRRLEFPAIGRLVPGPDGSVYVGSMPISNDMNLQEKEGMGVVDMIEKHGGSTGFTSAKDYYSLLLDVAFNYYAKSSDWSSSEARGNLNLYLLHQFLEHVRKRWIDDALDGGPFVLAHGDLERYNALVSDELDILAVIDWEWAQTVPLQLFLPPVWLTGRRIPLLVYDSFYEGYAERLGELCSVMEEREMERYGETVLSQDWTAMSKDSRILVGAALYSAIYIEDVMRNCVDHTRSSILTRATRVQEFIDEDPRRRDLVARKLAECEASWAEMERLDVREE